MGKDVGKREALSIAGEKANWYSHYGKKYGVSSILLNNYIPRDPAITFLGIQPMEMKSLILRDICALKFTAALFTIAKTWKQPKCLFKR